MPPGTLSWAAVISTAASPPIVPSTASEAVKGAEDAKPGGLVRDVVGGAADGMTGGAAVGVPSNMDSPLDALSDSYAQGALPCGRRVVSRDYESEALRV